MKQDSEYTCRALPQRARWVLNRLGHNSGTSIHEAKNNSFRDPVPLRTDPEDPHHIRLLGPILISIPRDFLCEDNVRLYQGCGSGSVLLCILIAAGSRIRCSNFTLILKKVISNTYSEMFFSAIDYFFPREKNSYLAKNVQIGIQYVLHFFRHSAV